MIRFTRVIRPVRAIGLASLIVFLSASAALAADFSSSNFKVKDPVIEELGGSSASTHFKLQGSVPYISPTPGASTNFQVNPGFAAFSGVVLPVLTASSGPDYAQVSLSWSAANGVSNATYEVGISATAGGPYTYDSSQTTRTAVKQNLSFAQGYNFVVRVKDGLGTIIGLSNEVSAVPQAFASGSGNGGGGGGGGSTYVSPSESGSLPLVTPPASEPGFIEGIVNAIGDFFNPQPEAPTYVFGGIPLEKIVPRQTPPALAGRWVLFPPKPIKDLVLRPLPAELQHLADVFPDINLLFKEVGITRFSDLEKLRNLSLNIPGLSDALLLPKDVAPGGRFAKMRDLRIAELTPDLKSKFPTDTLFTKLAGGRIDLKSTVRINTEGQPEASVHTVSGSIIELSVRPEFSAKQVTGYLLLRAPGQGLSERLPEPAAPFVARMFGIPQARAAQPALPVATSFDTALVVSQFAFLDPDGDGIYTARVQAPKVAGNYEVLTVVQYTDPDRGSSALRLLTVVDPEGYIFERRGDQELRIGKATVSLDWMNPQTNSFELWPAGSYSQENPQKTDVTGQYAFLVPPGAYRIRVAAAGYATHIGDQFSVKDGIGVHENIELQSAFHFRDMLDWRTISLLLVALMLLYNFYRDKLRERRAGSVVGIPPQLK